MKLSKEDADLFWRLMWNLQFYVNQQRGMLPKIKSVAEYARLSPTDKMPVREALWENPGLIDAYVKDNPDGLPAQELDIVRKWRRFVLGTFQIYRLLNKHAIWIGEGGQVYGVLALYDSLADVFQGRPLPVMVRAVLLPFKGRIIYDGLMQSYNLYFGGGIRSSLHEEYMAAKQNDRIITTLEPDLEQPKASRRAEAAPDKDWRPVVDEVVKTAEGMKGGPATQSAALALLRATAKLAQAAVHNPDDRRELGRLEQQVRRALSRLQTTLDRAER